MKIIGAGLPRTATTTQWLALRQLGLPTYHMKDMMADLRRGVDVWRRAYLGQQPWDEVFDGFEATVDWPAAYHWRELMDHYPDAKILLSVRDGDAWARSMNDTIVQIYFGDSFMRAMCLARYRIDPDWAAWMDLNIDTFWKGPRGTLANTFGERDKLVEAMERWNDEVMSTVPADRLIVWKPQDGWEPICEALGLPIPSEPLPHAFDTEIFKSSITGGAIEAVSAYWAKQQAAAAA